MPATHTSLFYDVCLLIKSQSSQGKATSWPHLNITRSEHGILIDGNKAVCPDPNVVSTQTPEA